MDTLVLVKFEGGVALEALGLVGAGLTVAGTRETGVVQSFEGFLRTGRDTLVITQDKGRLAGLAFLIIFTGGTSDWTIFTCIVL